MPKILVNVSESQKELWVASAHDERVSLSEWIRRRCDGGLAAGAGGAVAAPRRQGSSGLESRSVAASGTPAPAASSCVKFRTHHIYHSGKPCPECGYPTVEGAVT